MKALAAAGLLLSLGAVQTAHAGDWQVCQMEVEIIGALKLPVRGLEGRVESVKPRAAGADCPNRGALIAFEPESADWQSMIRVSTGQRQDSGCGCATSTWTASARATATAGRAGSSIIRWGGR